MKRQGYSKFSISAVLRNLAAQLQEGNIAACQFHSERAARTSTIDRAPCGYVSLVDTYALSQAQCAACARHGRKPRIGRRSPSRRTPLRLLGSKTNVSAGLIRKSLKRNSTRRLKGLRTPG